MIGKSVSHYRITGKLGAGGMGVVYRARDEQLDRDVAIKVLPADSFREPTSRARLLREARLASKLNHPHICTIYEVGEADGHAYIAMELVEGQPLSERLAEGPLRPDELLRYGLQLTEAVGHAHEHGVVHRDLKSANVVVTPDGRLKVLDFGLARQLSSDEPTERTTTVTRSAASLTEPGMVVGTLAYMPPEQLRGQAADARSDVWALGVMLHEMAAGERPFQGRTPFEVSSAILNQTAPTLPASVPAELKAIIERCLRKEPGQRYRRSSELHAALEAIQSGTAPARTGAPQKAWSRRRWIALAAVAAILVAVAAGMLVGWLLRRLPGVATAPTPHALAVLPLTNLSGDPNQKYFVDGLTEALIDDLSRVGGGLRVISSRSTKAYASTPKPIKQIARELGVDAVLEGSVVREGSLVRITAALIEAATERRLWSERYERTLTSILTLQSDVARAVARAVLGALSPEEEQKLTKTREVNPQVYEAYLKGMFYLSQSTPDALQKGMDFLHQAVEKDPTDPLAYAGLAGGYITLAHGAEPPPDALFRAKASARTALELDGTLPQAIFALGVIKGYDEWDWPGAEQTLRRAIELNPSFAMAHYHLAWFLALVGRMPEAIAEHIRAREADPLNPLHTAWLGELYRWDGQYERAIAEAKKSIELNPKFPPGHYVLGLTYANQGKWEQSIEAMRQAGEANPAWRWPLGAMFAVTGRTSEARDMLTELNKRPVTPYTALWRACLYSTLGEKDEAFKWLNYEHPHIWTPWLLSQEWKIFIQPLHGDPRFEQLRRKMNVPE